MSFWDLTQEAHFDADVKQRLFLTALEPDLAPKLAVCAHERGFSTETLINTWLSKKIAEASAR